MHPTLLLPELVHQSGMADKHRQCADLHERACRHFREAARLYERSDADQASYHSSIARRHAASALKADDVQNA